MDTLTADRGLFWMYLALGMLAFSSAGLLFIAAQRLRDLLAFWMALLLLFIAVDAYTKCVLRSPYSVLPLSVVFYVARLAAFGMAGALIGMTDCYFSQHNGHLDSLRRLMYWWRILRRDSHHAKPDRPA